MAWTKLKNGELREFCFLKLDIAGHSKIVRDNPKGIVSKTLDNFEDVITSLVDNAGGKVWTWQGDGGLLAFLDGESAETALCCSQDIIKSLNSFNRNAKLKDEIKVRIALHVGNAKFHRQTGRIHSDDINFVAHLEENCAYPNDICISHSVFTELLHNRKKQFKRLGDFGGRHIYSMKMKLRDKAEILPDHRALPNRQEVLDLFFHNELRIYSTTADNYFDNAEVYPTIEKKLCAGCKIKILLLDPKSKFMIDRERQEKTHFKKKQSSSIYRIRNIKKKFPKQIQLRFFSISPTYQSLIIDNDQMYIAINVFGSMGTAGFPCLRINNGPDTLELFDKFYRAFDSLWKISRRIL